MTYVAEDEWKPVGVAELEPRAEDVVRSSESRLVVAGPGAGKTELLAQRADFLFRTAVCAAPQRILAISFKRDAAQNLMDRVRKRTPDHADRFDSLTLDAFAKRLVDRFLPALPDAWRPESKYQIRTATIRAEEAELWLDGAPIPDGKQRPEVRGWEAQKVRAVLDQVMHGVELPYDQQDVNPYIRTWGLQWWREQLEIAPGRPSLTFPMLNRLAAYLLRQNKKIRNALRQTYRAVFLDEFQDTTASQWDVIRAAFAGSSAVLTAVGDSKQRIMVWAGAKVDVFEVYQRDFGATRTDLIRNYRSVPELVQVQHVIAQAVEAGTAKPISASALEGGGACSLIEFGNPEEEAAYIADLIADEIRNRSASPREFCILVRQRAGDMVETLRSALRSHGVALRDESTLQDLLVEPVTQVVINALRVGTKRRDAEAWSDLCGLIGALSGLDEERDGVELERIAGAHKSCVQKTIAAHEIATLPTRIVQVVGAERYRSTFRQYVGGDYLDSVLEGLGKALESSLDSTGDPARVADELMGVDVVPAMTIHKSKGLEFRAVIFLGLEDGQWWSFRSQPEEEKRAFFVAFSRAIQQVLFTFSEQRDTKWGRKRQGKENVDALHSILRQAGVTTVDMRGYGRHR